MLCWRIKYDDDDDDKKRKVNKGLHPSSGTDVYSRMPILRPHAARTW